MIHNKERKHKRVNSSFYQIIKFRRMLLNISKEELAKILDIKVDDITRCESSSNDINKNKSIIF